jgi:hypothetical protein
VDFLGLSCVIVSRALTARDKQALGHDRGASSWQRRGQSALRCIKLPAHAGPAFARATACRDFDLDQIRSGDFRLKAK